MTYIEKVFSPRFQQNAEADKTFIDNRQRWLTMGLGKASCICWAQRPSKKRDALKHAEKLVTPNGLDLSALKQLATHAVVASVTAFA